MAAHWTDEAQGEILKSWGGKKSPKKVACLLLFYLVVMRQKDRSFSTNFYFFCFHTCENVFINVDES